jgi:hypothetical protein
MFFVKPDFTEGQRPWDCMILVMLMEDILEGLIR